MFRALADTTRRAILEQLARSEQAAGELSSRFPISGPSVSRHLAVLKAAGLVDERREGNRIFYSLAPERLTATVGTFLQAVSAAPEPLKTKKRKSLAKASAGKPKRKVPPAKPAGGPEPRRPSQNDS